MRRARLARHRRVGTTARLLKSVPLLSALPERALTALAADAPLRTVPAGSRVIAELEPGEEALIVLRGVGKATVGGVGGGEPVEIGSILPGDCMGEMALFTGELRSATVTAETAMTLLVVDRLRFDELLHGYPAIAGHLARVLGTRLRESDRLLTAVLDPASSDAERRHALRGLAGGESDRHNRRLTTAMWVAWQELVARHRQELPFLMLLAFAITLVAVRSAVLVQRSILPQVLALETLLRASYVSGLLLLCASGTASLLFFRQRARRRVAILYGVGMALLFNALPVLLTFDLFYRDMVTPDPQMNFSADVLYERAEGANVSALAAILLFQAVYLRRFYRRVLSIVALRLTRWLRPPPLARPSG